MVGAAQIAEIRMPFAYASRIRFMAHVLSVIPFTPPSPPGRISISAFSVEASSIGISGTT